MLSYAYQIEQGPPAPDEYVSPRSRCPLTPSSRRAARALSESAPQGEVAKLQNAAYKQETVKWDSDSDSDESDDDEDLKM